MDSRKKWKKTVDSDDEVPLFPEGWYSLAAANNWHMFSSDITQAFTYGKLDVPL